VAPADVIANPGAQLFILLGAVMALSYAATYSLSRIFTGQTYRYMVAPGVIVHELSHALGCVATGARIREVRVFDERGGRVVHEEPRFALGQGIISVAPVFGAAVAVYVLATFLVPSFVGFGELEISSWQFLVFAYLASSITAAMAPSVQDLKFGLGSFAAICLVLGVTALIPTTSNWATFVIGDSYDRFVGVIQFSLLVLAVLAAASGLVLFALHRTSRRGVPYRSFE
jgi:hypothetical protein